MFFQLSPVIALWKSRANRNFRRELLLMGEVIALWKSRANRNFGQRRNKLMAVIALWKSRANRNKEIGDLLGKKL